MKRDGWLIWAGCVLLFFAGAVWGGVLPKTDFFRVTDVHDLADIFGAIATVFAVAFGFSAWKKQLRGHTDHELAKRILLETERFKEQTLGITRTAENCLTSSNLHNADWSFLQEVLRILRSDLEKSDECRINMEALLIEADVIWGGELRTRYSGLRDLNDMCCLYIRSYLRFLEDPDDDSEGDDFSWVDDRLSQGGWNSDEHQRRENMNTLLTQATAYLKKKLVN